VIRLHTRVPVVDPGRISEDLIQALRTDRALYVAVHSNHAREFTASARAACARLTRAGIPLLGQTVLLRGVNDHEQALERLMRVQVEQRIKPYYLHHGDLARGTSHFRVAISRGQQLLSHLRGRLSGLCQPTYVIDLPGGAGKVPIGPSYVEARHESHWTLRDLHGRLHEIPDLA
ncbi:MAG: lysine 2,3-aminomutase, partial [Pseudomonadota bacterium]